MVASFGRHVQRRRQSANTSCNQFLHWFAQQPIRRLTRQVEFTTATCAVQEIPKFWAVAPSQSPRLRASCGCLPPSGSETKLWSVPDCRPSEPTSSQQRWPCVAMRAARTSMTCRVAAKVVDNVVVLALRRARRQRIERRGQETRIHHENKLTTSQGTSGPKWSRNLVQECSPT